MTTQKMPLYRLTYSWYDGDNDETKQEEVRAESPEDVVFDFLNTDPGAVNFIINFDKFGSVTFTKRPADTEPEYGWNNQWAYDDPFCIRENSRYYYGYWKVTGPLTKKTCECCNGTGEVDA